MKDQIIGLYAAHRCALGRVVSEMYKTVLLHGILYGFDFRGKAAFVPRGQINEHVGAAGYQGAVSGGQLFHELSIAPGAADAVQTAQPRQNGLHLRGSKHRAVHPVSLHDGDPAACPLRGGDRDARPAEGFDVPLDGAAGHFELLCQFRCGDLFPLKKDRQNADQPIHLHGNHRPWFFCLYYTIATGQLSVMFGFANSFFIKRPSISLLVLPQYAIGVLFGRCNKPSDVDIVIFWSLHFLPKMFDNISKIGIFPLIITELFAGTPIGE